MYFLGCSHGNLRCGIWASNGLERRRGTGWTQHEFQTCYRDCRHRGFYQGALSEVDLRVGTHRKDQGSSRRVRRIPGMFATGSTTCCYYPLAENLSDAGSRIWRSRSTSGSSPMKRTRKGISFRIWSMRTRSSWKTENRDSGKGNSLVRGQRSVYWPVHLQNFRPGNMYMFYIAGHEVRVLYITRRVDRSVG